MADNTFKYKITAEDDTAKGVNSAEKRIGQLSKEEAANQKARRAETARLSKLEKKETADRKKRISEIAKEIKDQNKRYDDQNSVMVGGMTQARRGVSALLSTSSGLSGWQSSLGDFHGSLSSAVDGMNKAREAGGGLGGTLAGLAATGGGVIGVMGALAAGAVKMASGWAEGGAQLGRLSQSLGVSTDDIQKFQAVGEQFGVGKEETTGAVSGIGSTIHEAKYGRNNEALAAMNQLGLTMKTGKDGRPDIAAMTLDLADLIARQKDPYTQARIAGVFGASSALPMLRQGSAAIKARMDAAAKYAAVMPESNVGDSTRIYEKGVRLGQLTARGVMFGDRAAALGSEGALDYALRTGEGLAGGGQGGVPGGVGSIAREGVTMLGGAAKWAGGEVEHLGAAIGGMAGDLRDRIEHLGEHSRQDQVSPKGARGVMQIMPGTAQETAARHGIPWSEERYRNDADYSRQLGEAYLGELQTRYGGDEALMAAAYNAGPGRVDRDRRRYTAAHGGSFDEAAFVRDPHYLPKETRDYVSRVTGGDRRIVLEPVL